MSDQAIFWIAMIGATAFNASSRTYALEEDPSWWDLAGRLLDVIGQLVATVVGLVYLVKWLV